MDTWTAAAVDAASGILTQRLSLAFGALAIAALFMTLVLVVTARRTSRDLATAAWNPDLGLPTYHRWLDVLRREVNRARRYGRPLSVVVGRVGELGALDDAVATRFAPTHRQRATRSVGFLVRELLRDADLATYDPSADHFVLLLPETELGPARTAVARIADVIHKRTGARLRFGVAAFPDHGLITEDLVSFAADDCAAAAGGVPIRPVPAASPLGSTAAAERTA